MLVSGCELGDDHGVRNSAINAEVTLAFESVVEGMQVRGSYDERKVQGLGNAVSCAESVREGEGAYRGRWLVCWRSRGAKGRAPQAHLTWCSPCTHVRYVQRKIGRRDVREHTTTCTGPGA